MKVNSMAAELGRMRFNMGVIRSGCNSFAVGARCCRPGQRGAFVAHTTSHNISLGTQERGIQHLWLAEDVPRVFGCAPQSRQMRRVHVGQPRAPLWSFPLDGYVEDCIGCATDCVGTLPDSPDSPHRLAQRHRCSCSQMPSSTSSTLSDASCKQSLLAPSPFISHSESDLFHQHPTTLPSTVHLFVRERRYSSSAQPTDICHQPSGSRDDYCGPKASCLFYIHYFQTTSTIVSLENPAFRAHSTTLVSMTVRCCRDFHQVVATRAGALWPSKPAKRKQGTAPETLEPATPRV